MNRILLTLICVAATLTAFAQGGASAPPEDPSAPKMVFTNEVYNFDSIVQGDTVKYTFKFKNDGKSPLLITEAIVGCGCTQPTFSKEPIAPGKTGTIYVEFRSAGKIGVQDKTITVKSNNGGGDVVLHLKGKVVTPAPAPAPGNQPRSGPVNK